MTSTDQSIAHGSDLQRATLRLELEGRTERIRQQMAHMRFFESLGEYTMSGQIQGMLARERMRQTDLETALGMDAPAPRNVGGTRHRPSHPVSPVMG